MFGRKRRQEDGVALALQQLEQQNAGLVRLAHFFAGLLVIATSVASLIALAGDTVQLVATSLEGHGGTIQIPIIASICITFFLVLAMDTGMLLAAGQVRVKLARHASANSMGFDLVILISVALLEAGTYCYMLWQYEHPANQLTGVLIIARAFAVPLLSMYLVMARPVTVMPGDILHLASLASGTGFLHDVADIASNKMLPTKATQRKMQMFAAASQLTPAQRSSLVNLIKAAQDPEGDEDGMTFLDEPAVVVEADPPKRPNPLAQLRARFRRQPKDDTAAADGDDDADVTPPPRGNRRRALAAAGRTAGIRETHGRE
ncbi:MAG: hypothetical protein H0U76_20405 [Ktedonobacteraceae bacterium]|nr:hypothetical protein [Ktedonobacteraceae bacterium]